MRSTTSFKRFRLNACYLLLATFSFHFLLGSGLVVFEDKDAFIKICKKRYVLVLDLPLSGYLPEGTGPTQEVPHYQCPSVFAVYLVPELFIFTSYNAPFLDRSVTHTLHFSALSPPVEVPPPQT